MFEDSPGRWEITKGVGKNCESPMVINYYCVSGYCGPLGVYVPRINKAVTFHHWFGVLLAKHAKSLSIIVSSSSSRNTQRTGTRYRCFRNLSIVWGLYQLISDNSPDQFKVYSEDLIHFCELVGNCQVGNCQVGNCVKIIFRFNCISQRKTTIGMESLKILWFLSCFARVLAGIKHPGCLQPREWCHLEYPGYNRPTESDTSPLVSWIFVLSSNS